MARKQAKAQREKPRSDELGCAQRLTRSERDRRAFFAALIAIAIAWAFGFSVVSSLLTC